MLNAQNILWKPGGKPILQGVTFRLKNGEIVGLVGPNGSGKSSLLKILAFLESPTQGILTFHGQSITGKVPLSIRRKIAVVFQEPLLLNTTVFENVAAGLKIRGVPKPETQLRVENWLTRFGISHLAKQHAHSLSGGEAQRVSLARAFVLEPSVLFMDEPFSALDVSTKESLLEDLSLILKTTSVTAVLISHDFRDILRLTQRTVILVDGKIAAEGNPYQLLHSAQPDSVQQFLSPWRISLMRS
ncbi:energy-coupling factor ABC transporter ATP-binding protein [Effusibacillus consociatus]|uniref:Energy-coupling factor ABC transporter ATP-binding protein n=1 Tax=Effusibacillus consociatus TaxID=1117041 RepID=A0ABV9Q836_9BACL